MSFISKALKKVSTVLNDAKNVGGNVVSAQATGQPLTKEQIIKNTSMAPKPPGTPVNTSGRPPVAPPVVQGPAGNDRIQPNPPGPTASTINAQPGMDLAGTEPLNMIAAGAGPWDKPKTAPSGNMSPAKPIAMVNDMIKKAGGLYNQGLSKQKDANWEKTRREYADQLYRDVVYDRLSRRDYDTKMREWDAKNPRPRR